MAKEEISEEEQLTHKAAMQAVKSAVSQKVAEARNDKGLIIVLTGNGKGKSSSGFGMILRALGHKMRVGVVQFIKGQWETGEKLFFKANSEIDYFVMGDGFTWDTQDKAGDIKRAQACWEAAKRMIEDSELDLVLLDEINVVIDFGYIDFEEVATLLRNKPHHKHVILTGRGAKPELLALADTVSVIESPKHAFESGIRAQKGIEF